MNNQDVLKNFDIILSKIEEILKSNNLYTEEIREQCFYFLERFYSLCFYEFETKNDDIYSNEAELISLPMIKEVENEDEFTLRKLIMVLLQYVFDVFHNKIDKDRINLKLYLIEDYKYLNKNDDLNVETNKIIKDKVVNLMNKMINSKKKKSTNNHVCKFFNTSRGCRYGDNCRFTHIVKEQKETLNDLEFKDL